MCHLPNTAVRYPAALSTWPIVANFGIEPARARPMRAEHLGPPGIAAAQQRRPRRRADRLRHVEVVKRGSPAPPAARRWRRIGRIAEGPEIGLSGIVEEDDDDVGPLSGHCCGSRSLEKLASSEVHRHGCENYIRAMKIATFNVNSIRRRAARRARLAATA